MEKNWLEIFDSLFGDKKEQYFYNGDKNMEIPNELKNVISKIQEMTDESFTKEEIDDIFEQELGEPAEIIEYSEGNIDYTKKVWDNPEGRFVRILASVKDGIQYEDLSLDEKLKLAIQNEEYEKAAELKEQIENKNFIDNIDGENIGNQEDDE